MSVTSTFARKPNLGGPSPPHQCSAKSKRRAPSSERKYRLRAAPEHPTPGRPACETRTALTRERLPGRCAHCWRRLLQVEASCGTPHRAGQCNLACIASSSSTRGNFSPRGDQKGSRKGCGALASRAPHYVYYVELCLHLLILAPRWGTHTHTHTCYKTEAVVRALCCEAITPPPNGCIVGHMQCDTTTPVVMDTRTMRDPHMREHSPPASVGALHLR